MHFGEIGKRYELKLKLIRQSEFKSFFGYNQMTNIYTFEDSDGNQFVWKTSANLGIESEIQRKGCEWKDLKFEAVLKNDTATIKATIKEHSEYKGIEQTILTRVKVMSIEHAPTKQELDEQKSKEQRESLQDGDFIRTMSYSQYKEHYSDCETLAGSFKDYRDSRGVSVRRPTIDVIIRAGRLKPSGVRGKHFRGYVFLIDGKRCSYRAVSEENAERRCRKDYPEATSIECVRIYD